MTWLQPHTKCVVVRKCVSRLVNGGVTNSYSLLFKSVQLKCFPMKCATL